MPPCARPRNRNRSINRQKNLTRRALTHHQVQIHASKTLHASQIIGSCYSAATSCSERDTDIPSVYCPGYFHHLPKTWFRTRPPGPHICHLGCWTHANTSEGASEHHQWGLDMRQHSYGNLCIVRATCPPKYTFKDEWASKNEVACRLESCKVTALGSVVSHGRLGYFDGSTWISTFGEQTTFYGDHNRVGLYQAIRPLLLFEELLVFGDNYMRRSQFC